MWRYLRRLERVCAEDRNAELIDTKLSTVTVVVVSEIMIAQSVCLAADAGIDCAGCCCSESVQPMLRPGPAPTKANTVELPRLQRVFNGRRRQYTTNIAARLWRTYWLTLGRLCYSGPPMSCDAIDILSNYLSCELAEQKLAVRMFVICGATI